MSLLEAIKARVAERAVEHQLHSLAGPIAGQAQLRVGLRETDDPAEAVGQVGGIPMLPAGMPWPKVDDVPLVAWLHVELDRLPRPSALPTSGRLTFFLMPDPNVAYLDHLDAGGGQVLLTPSAAECVPATPPPGTTILEPRTLRASLETSLPSIESVFFHEAFERVRKTEEQLWEREHELDDDQLPPDTEPQQRYEALQEAIRSQSPDGTARPLDRATPTVLELLGHPSPCQDDPLMEHAVRSLDPPLAYPLDPPQREAAEQEARTWRLLAQAPANRALGYDILTGGWIYLLIPEADLAAGRFDRVVSITQR